MSRRVRVTKTWLKRSAFLFREAPPLLEIDAAEVRLAQGDKRFFVQLPAEIPLLRICHDLAPVADDV